MKGSSSRARTERVETRVAARSREAGATMAAAIQRGQRMGSGSTSRASDNKGELGRRRQRDRDRERRVGAMTWAARATGRRGLIESREKREREKRGRN